MRYNVCIVRRCLMVCVLCAYKRSFLMLLMWVFCLSGVVDWALQARTEHMGNNLGVQARPLDSARNSQQRSRRAAKRRRYRHNKAHRNRAWRAQEQNRVQPVKGGSIPVIAAYADEIGSADHTRLTAHEKELVRGSGKTAKGWLAKKLKSVGGHVNALFSTTKETVISGVKKGKKLIGKFASSATHKANSALDQVDAMGAEGMQDKLGGYADRANTLATKARGYATQVKEGAALARGVLEKAPEYVELARNKAAQARAVAGQLRQQMDEGLATAKSAWKTGKEVGKELWQVGKEVGSAVAGE